MKQIQYGKILILKYKWLHRVEIVLNMDFIFTCCIDGEGDKSQSDVC